jgi:hypothetical protein
MQKLNTVPSSNPAFVHLLEKIQKVIPVSIFIWIILTYTVTAIINVYFLPFYNLDKNKLITSWLSDQIANSILYEENIGEVLKVAEEKAIYLKTIHDGK